MVKRKEFKFYPLVEFEWYREDIEKLIGHYIPGMSYNCTLEARHDTLFQQCQEWEKEGKIKIVPLVNEHFITVGDTGDGSTT